jgi:hypothetical protein
VSTDENTVKTRASYVLRKVRALVADGEFDSADRLIGAHESNLDAVELLRARLLLNSARGSWADASESGVELLDTVGLSRLSEFDRVFLDRVAACAKNSQLRHRLSA